jgi:hypothetical protein
MQIQDYASLTQAISDFAHRTDLANNLYTDYFIQLAQNKLAQEIITENMGNGIQAMEVALTPVAISGGTLAVPIDWYTPKALQVLDNAGNVFPLIFKASTWIYETYPMRQPQGLPAYIAREAAVSGGSVFIFGPYPDSNYTVQGTYYSRGTPLSPTTPTNWMVSLVPEALHAACMVEAGKFLKDQTMVGTWMPIFKDFVDGIVEKDRGERFSSSTMQIETA